MIGKTRTESMFFHSRQKSKNMTVYINNKKLLDAENIKFSMGESSMFLVNSREVKLIEIQQKLVSLKTKFFKSIVANLWAAGLLK